MSNVNKVLYNIDQTGDTTDAEKALARANIGASDGKISWVTIPEGGQPRISKSGLSVVTRPSGTYIQDDEGNVKFYLAPDFESGYAGKILGILDGGAIGWRNAPREVPESTSQDADKILTVDANGTPAWNAPASRIAYSDWGSQGNNSVIVDNDHWAMPVYTNASAWSTVYIPVQPGQTLMVNFACACSIPNASVTMQLVPSDELHSATSGVNSDYTFTPLVTAQLGICDGEHFVSLVWNNSGTTVQTVALILKNLTGSQRQFTTTRTTAVTF